MEHELIEKAAQARAAVMNDGAEAARGGKRRTDNPFDADSEEWLVWRDGFEQQLAWSDLGRGEYHADARTACPALARGDDALSSATER